MARNRAPAAGQLAAAMRLWDEAERHFVVTFPPAKKGLDCAIAIQRAFAGMTPWTFSTSACALGRTPASGIASHSTGYVRGQRASRSPCATVERHLLNVYDRNGAFGKAARARYATEQRR
jgi:hypothetical protein